VKNNLQVVMSLLHLQADRLSDTAACSLFQETQLRIRSMALIHERLYQAKDLSCVNLKEYICSLAEGLFGVYGESDDRIRLNVKMKEIVLGIDMSIPCGLIINELLLNCFKHAFPPGRQGRITVSLERAEDDRFVLAVADDGIGMPVDFDPYASPSLGFSLVIALTEQLNGALHVIRKRGTKIEILFGQEGRAAPES
jgi:two-component sensor histidine kinase